MGLYCWWEPSGDFSNPDNPGSQLVCIEIPDEVVVPPEEPADGEDDPSGEITLPDGTVVDATGLVQPFVGLKQIAWQAEPYRCLWGVRTDGLLVSLTYDKEEDVWAWARHPMSNGAVMSIAVIPSASSEQDELWAVIRREVDGATVHYVERMTPRIEPEDENDKSRFNFLDSSLVYSGTATDTFSGADHLEGLTCRVWADGADMGDFEISGGAFTLPVEAEDVVVGLHTDASIVTLPAARLATERQILQGAHVRFYETLGGKVGPTPTNMETLLFRTPSDYMDDTPPLFDGDMDVTVGSSWSDSGVLVITQDTAGPMTVLAVFPRFRVG